MALLGWLSMPAAADPLAKDVAPSVRGTVVWQGKPAGAGVSVALNGVVKATTDASGAFVVPLPADWKGGVALSAANADGTRQAYVLTARAETDRLKMPIQLALKPAKRLTVSVRDGAGKPVARARVGAVVRAVGLPTVVTAATGQAVVLYPEDAVLVQVLAFKAATGVDYCSYPRPKAAGEKPPLAQPAGEVRLTLEKPHRVAVKLTDPDGKPLVGVNLAPSSLAKPGESYGLDTRMLQDEMPATTDARGVAVIDWLPPWQERRVTLVPQTKTHLARGITYDIASGKGYITHLAQPLRSGKPNLDNITTGKGQLTVVLPKLMVPEKRGLLLFAGNDRLAAALRRDIVATSDKPATGIDFKLRPTTRVYGRLTQRPGKEPFADQVMLLYAMVPPAKNRLARPEEDIENSAPHSFQRTAFTDKAGRYEFLVGPGWYDLHLGNHSSLKAFAVADEKSLTLDFTVTPRRQVRLTGLAVSGTPPKPVAGARFEEIGHGGNTRSMRTDKEGKFSFTREQGAGLLVARSADGKLAGFVTLTEDTTTVTVTLRPVVTVRARLVDGGKPVAGREITWGAPFVSDGSMRFSSIAMGEVKTGADGRFELAGVVVGLKYYVDTLRDPARPNGTIATIVTFQAKEGKTLDLGDVRLPKPRVPPTPRDRAEKALAAPKTPAERLDAALDNAKLARQRVLLVFGDSKAAHTQRLFALRSGDTEGDEEDKTSSAFFDYQVVGVATADKGADELLRRLKLTLAKRALPLLVVCDADGAHLALVEADALVASGQIDAGKVRGFLTKHAPAPLDARKLLAEALAQAKKEKKRVLVQETATTCPPCWRLSRYLESQRCVWEKDYIWVRIDRRWTHADAVMDGLKKGHRGGIPWLAVLGGDGKVLATSNDANGDNIGFPSQAAGIDHFIGMLRQTRTRLSDADLARLRQALPGVRVRTGGE